MNEAAAQLAAPSPPPRGLDRVRATLATLGAAVLGAAPHVLHHVGPLAGAALLAGASGKLLFGVLGLLAAVPLLRRLRRRSGSWRVPAGALALMVAMFTFSTLVIGPALTGTDDDSATRSSPKSSPGLTEPSPNEHDPHHR